MSSALDDIVDPAETRGVIAATLLVNLRHLLLGATLPRVGAVAAVITHGRALDSA